MPMAMDYRLFAFFISKLEINKFDSMLIYYGFLMYKVTYANNAT